MEKSIKSIEDQFINSLVEKYKAPQIVKLLQEQKNIEKLSKSTFGGASYVEIIQTWIEKINNNESINLDIFLINNLPFIRVPHLLAVLGDQEKLIPLLETYKTAYVSYEEEDMSSIYNTVNHTIYKNYDDFIVPVELSKVISWGLYDNLEVVSTFFCSKEKSFIQFDYETFETDDLARAVAKNLIENYPIDQVYFRLISTPFEVYEKEQLFTIPELISNLYVEQYNFVKKEAFYTKFEADKEIELLEFILRETALYDKKN